MFSVCSRNSSCVADEEVNTARRVKDGELMRYKPGFFGSKWTQCYMVLMSDARLLLFNNNTESKASEYFFLPEAVPFMCVGQMTDRLPAKRPQLPPNTSLNHLVGIGLDATGEKAYWLLFPTDSDLEDWLQNIIKLLPGPHQNTNPPQFPSASPTLSYPQNPQQNGPPLNYPQQQYPNGQPNTIIIHDNRGRDSPAPSPGLALVGGMLAGSLVGYGIGSMFHPELVSPPQLNVPPVQTSEMPPPVEGFNFENNPAPQPEMPVVEGFNFGGGNPPQIMTENFILDGTDEPQQDFGDEGFD